ncbi:complement factor H-related protein 5-like [Orycteropus afer afer]|uniref:Complement factor H-related protein 5-like n=1 Tax=Orycteropus afer afer TaxID=1230840 RepID=A0AC54Z7Z0_ORYAF|nr:complement factor H-related protein 5-like [Orycteropus afer afer]
MLLSISVILILWFSTVGGQGGFCGFPKIKHGILYDENKYKSALPAAVGTIFYYSCEYSFMSPSKSFWTRITCTEEGWLPTPKCLRLCFFPSVENGYSSSAGKTHIEGNMVKIDCDIGYKLPNNESTISCAEGGWSSPPKCSSIKIECPVPLLEENLDVHPKRESYKYGEVLKFSCRRRLTRVGPDSVQCYQFGWSPNLPTCKGHVKSCGSPLQLPNGKVKAVRKEEYQHSEVVEYHCNPKFLLKGPSKIQCMDGEWTTLPTCVEQVKTCGDIPKMEHGYGPASFPPYQHGHSVELNCRNTHTMIGNNRITCINGMWTQLPKCIATDQLKQCKRPRLYSTAQFIPSLHIFEHNTRAQYRCIGNQKSMVTICINGKWDPEPDCTEKVQFCPPPPQIPNAQNMVTTVNYQDGEKVAVLCKQNFSLQDTGEIVCKNGRWQSLPQCVEFTGQCGPPPPIANGDITSFPLAVYPPGSSVKYLCQSFYELRGSTVVTCRDGQWSEPPICVDACVISEENMNKNNIQLKWIKDKKLYSKTGDIIEFECIHAYKMKTPQQSFRATCQEGKIEYPRCE